jgi:RNA polymerase sigma-70 factor, ECF subfamily
MNCPLTIRSEHLEQLLAEGAARLLARAKDSCSLTAPSLLPRLQTVVNKYLLRDEENASDAALAGFIDELHADDLCLIVACECGQETAWNDLVNRFSPTVRSAARSASSNEEAAEDLAQSIWAELYGLRTGKDGRQAGKLAYYSGRGSLAGWLRAVVAQLAVDHHRKQSRLVQTEDDADFDRLARDGGESKQQLVSTQALNPEQLMSEKLAGSEVQDALARSIRELSDEDRLLVKLYYFDGLRLREAGVVLGIHEATASRRLTRIHSELRLQVERILTQERGWTKAETERSFAEVALHLEADLEPLLASGAILSDS